MPAENKSFAAVITARQILKPIIIEIAKEEIEMSKELIVAEEGYYTIIRTPTDVFKEVDSRSLLFLVYINRQTR